MSTINQLLDFNPQFWSLNRILFSFVLYPCAIPAPPPLLLRHISPIAAGSHFLAFARMRTWQSLHKPSETDSCEREKPHVDFAVLVGEAQRHCCWNKLDQTADADV